MAQLDRINIEFERASKVFGVALADGEMELAKREIENKQLTDQLEHAIANLSAERHRASEQTSMLSGVEERRRMAEASLATAAEESIKLHTERQSLERRVSDLLVEQGQLQAGAKESASKLQVALDRTLTNLSAERQRAAEQADPAKGMLKSACRIAEGKLAIAVEESATLRIERQSHEQRICDLLSEHSQFQAVVESTDSRIQELERELFAREVLLRSMDKKCDEMQRALESLQSSLSLRSQSEASLLATEQQRMVELSQRRVELTQVRRELTESEQSYERVVRENQLLKKSMMYQVRIRALWVRRQVGKALRLIRHGKAPSLFDEKWYLSRYPEVIESGKDPYYHYLNIGAKESYFPNALFDTSWYLEKYPDVQAAGINPLVHYTLHGGRERRDPHPLFNSSWYLEQYLDVAECGFNPLAHYLFYGAAEGRDPNPMFDSDWYLDQYPEARGTNPLAHFAHDGAKRGCNPNPFFDATHCAK